MKPDVLAPGVPAAYCYCVEAFCTVCFEDALAVCQQKDRARRDRIAIPRHYRTGVDRLVKCTGQCRNSTLKVRSECMFSHSKTLTDN